MDCNATRKLFPALLSGELSAQDSADTEEHLLACEDCSAEFEAYESRFFQQYEPAGKILREAAKLPLPEKELQKYSEALRARLTGLCAEVRGVFPAYLSGEMDAPLSSEVEGHLQGCEGCSREFEAYETKVFSRVETAGKALAAARAVTPPEAALVGFYQKVVARIEADRRRNRFGGTGWINAAAALVLCASLAVLFARKDAAPLPVSTGVAHEQPTLDVPPVPRETVRPASESPATRSFSLPNRRAEDFSTGSRRRPGGVNVISPQGNHSLDSVKPLENDASVGF